MIRYWLIGVAASVALASVASFVAYAWDKRQARLRRWRIAENRLHLLALLGGWPGAWLARRVLRHKTVKPAFRRVFWLTAALHLAAVAGVTGWLVAR